MKVFNGEEKEAKPKDVAVVLRGRELLAVDAETGEFIIRLYNFRYMHAEGYASMCLKVDGYRTDFATWDKEGQMTKLLEDFE